MLRMLTIVSFNEIPVLKGSKQTVFSDKVWEKWKCV